MLLKSFGNFLICLIISGCGVAFGQQFTPGQFKKIGYSTADINSLTRENLMQSSQIDLVQFDANNIAEARRVFRQAINDVASNPLGDNFKAGVVVFPGHATSIAFAKRPDRRRVTVIFVDPLGQRASEDLKKLFYPNDLDACFVDVQTELQNVQLSGEEAICGPRAIEVIKILEDAHRYQLLGNMSADRINRILKTYIISDPYKLRILQLKQLWNLQNTDQEAARALKNSGGYSEIYHQLTEFLDPNKTLTISELEDALADIGIGNGSLSRRQHIIQSANHSNSFKKIDQTPSYLQADEEITQNLVDVGALVSSAVESRSDRLNIANFAPSAGSSHSSNEYGVWFEQQFSFIDQGQYQLMPKYKTRLFVSTIGGDVGNDDFMLGSAYSIAQSYQKGANLNKENTDMHVFSLYGQLTITDYLFLKGQAYYGKSLIHRKRSASERSKATAKIETEGRISGGHAELGYNFAHNGFAIMPSMGIGHNMMRIGEYKEDGAGILRTKTDSRKMHATKIFSKVVFGTRHDVSEFITADISVYGKYSRLVSAKNPPTTGEILDDIKFSSPVQKFAPDRLDVGSAICFDIYDSYKIKLGYNLGVKNKYQSHTCSLMLRIDL